ncbi:hypothetical protein [Variovorax guangxiensis]|nr:hypothetical protein [Variovorax guangxiensis]MDR6856097.1 hypothetical protein [Variovorax guangxiensis]
MGIAKAGVGIDVNVAIVEAVAGFIRNCPTIARPDVVGWEYFRI